MKLFRAFIFLLLVPFSITVLLAFTNSEKKITVVEKKSIFQNKDISAAVQQLIDEQVLNPMKAMHDPANIKMFSRAYIGSVWKYELVSKPTAKQKYYELELRELRGAFIIDQYKMRVYEADKKVLLENWKANTYLPANEWIEFYKNQKGKQ